MTENEITQPESPLEKKRREDRERKQKQRAREKVEKAAEGESIESAWQRHSEQLKKDAPVLYKALQERHEEIAGLEAEITEVCEGVANGLRAEVRTAATADSTEIFPRPDHCWRDAKADIEQHGAAPNYYHIIEAEPQVSLKSEDFLKLENTAKNVVVWKGYVVPGEAVTKANTSEAKIDWDRTTGSAAMAYRYFGFRLCINIDAFRHLTQAFLQYALTTQGKNLDRAIVEEAITWYKEHQNDFTSPGIDERLIRQYLTPSTRNEEE